MDTMRVGYGFDVHQLVAGRPLILGGVTIPYDKGLMGHSDADVIVHAVMDAMLGALALGSIGDHFPDTDPAYRGADSMQLLAYVQRLVGEKGFSVVNMDVMVNAQEPKLNLYIPQMRMNVASALQTGIDRVSIKAGTTERMGFVGRLEGLSASAVVLLNPRG
jgi:2-C-methyl-D-erythritol 2,4-cyclodiphosphate synthase